MRARFWLSLWFSLLAAVSLAQEGFETLDANEAMLFFSINANISGQTVVVRDGNKEEIHSTVWDSELPFVKPYVLPAGVYSVALPTSPVLAVDIILDAGVETYLQVGPAVEDGTEVLRISASVGAATEQIAKTLTILQTQGRDDLLGAARISSPSGILLFDTEPTELLLDTEPPVPIPPPKL